MNKKGGNRRGGRGGEAFVRWMDGDRDEESEDDDAGLGAVAAGKLLGYLESVMSSSSPAAHDDNEVDGDALLLSGPFDPTLLLGRLERVEPNTRTPVTEREEKLRRRRRPRSLARG